MNKFDIEILAVGLWNGIDFTDADLTMIAYAFDKLKEVHKVPMKIGHNDEQKLTDGQPKLGAVTKVQVVGDKLMATIESMPDIVFSAIEQGLYDSVSVELDMGVEHSGEFFMWVLSGVALLGADIPAVNTLADLTSFMSREYQLPHKKRIAFSAIQNVNKFSKRGFTMNEEEYKAKIASLEAKNKLLQDDSDASNADLKKQKEEREGLEAKVKKSEEENAEKEKVEQEKELMSKLDTLVKEKKILPAVREEFMKDYKDSGDYKTLLFAVKKLESLEAKDSKLFNKGDTKNKSKDSKDEDGLTPDRVVLSRINKHMLDTGEKDFKTAKSKVLRADLELAEEYAHMGDD